MLHSTDLSRRVTIDSPTSPSSWVKGDLSRVENEFSQQRKRSTIFSDSTDSDTEEDEQSSKMPSAGGANSNSAHDGARNVSAWQNTSSVANNLKGHFQSSQDAENAIASHVVPPPVSGNASTARAARRPQQAPAPAPVVAVANDDKKSTDELLKMPYMKLKRYLIASGLRYSMSTQCLCPECLNQATECLNQATDEFGVLQ